MERVEQLGHYPKRIKKPTTDGERAENSLAMRISKQWSKLDDATKAKLTRLQQSVTLLLQAAVAELNRLLLPPAVAAVLNSHLLHFAVLNSLLLHPT